MIKKYSFNEMYHIDKEKQLACNGVWEKEDIKVSIQNTIDKQFQNQSTLFTLFQSNMHIHPDLYLPIIYNNIQIKLLE